jgi:multiple sugar transport system ATP-binding protein
MVFQSYALYPHMTAYENMAFGLERARHSRADIDARVRRAAETLGLTPLLQRLPRDLSGGQRQRVAIGRAIVREPRLFLFDEPLSNLDAALRVQTRVELARLHRELGATTLYVTHDQAEAMTLGDRIVVLNRGRVEQVGAPLELYHRPANRFVAGFIGSPPMNFVEARVDGVDGSAVRVRLPGAVALTVRARGAGLRADDPVTLGVRPEHVILADAGASGDTPGLPLALPCLLVEQLGESHLLHLQWPGGGTLTVRAAGDARQRAGDRLDLILPAARCHLFAADGRALGPPHEPPA